MWSEKSVEELLSSVDLECLPRFSQPPNGKCLLHDAERKGRALTLGMSV